MVRVKYIDEAHDIGVLQLLEKRDLTDGRRRDTLVLRLKTDLF